MRRLNPDLVIAAILACSTFALYSPTLGFDFVNYDDDEYVTENVHVLKGVSADDAVWAFTSFDAANWHPLTWLSLQVDVSLFGPAAGAFHRTNVLLHAVNASLLFLALRSLKIAREPAAFSALLFAWHPLHVESVAWISERKDVLSTFFGMLALWAYARYAETPSHRWYAAVVALFAFSLMAKPMLVTLPFLYLLLDFWPLKRPLSFRLVIEKLPLFALAIASCAVTVVAQRQAMSSLDRIPFAARLGNVAVAYVQYLAMTFWPLNLAPFYPYPDASEPKTVAAALLVLAAITGVAVRVYAKRPYFLIGWLWFLGTLVPVIGLVQVGAQSLADRYTYFPLIGLFLAINLGATDALALVKSANARRRTAWATAALLALACLVLTTYQLSYWQNSLTLRRHAVSVTPYSAYAHIGLARALEKSGDAAAGRAHFEEALRLEPENGNVHLAFGNALIKAGDLAGARRHLEAAVRLEPDDPRPHNDLAALLEKMGDVPGAEAGFRKALSLDPNLVTAQSNLGLLLLNRGDPASGLPYLEAAVRQKLERAEFYNNLGLVLSRLNRDAEADQEFREAVRLDPSLGVAYFNLGMSANKRGDLAAAVDSFRAALKLNPKHAASHFGLGSSLESAGRPLEALSAYHLAVQLDPEWPPYRRTLAVLDCRQAWSLATNADARSRDGARAVALAEEAQRLLGSPDPGCLDVLAAAYAEAGRFTDAVAAVQKALAANPPPPGAFDRLRLYESGRPYHAPIATSEAGR